MRRYDQKPPSTNPGYAPGIFHKSGYSEYVQKWNEVFVCDLMSSEESEKDEVITVKTLGVTLLSMTFLHIWMRSVHRKLNNR